MFIFRNKIKYYYINNVIDNIFIIMKKELLSVDIIFRSIEVKCYNSQQEAYIYEALGTSFNFLLNKAFS